MDVWLIFFISKIGNIQLKQPFIKATVFLICETDDVGDGLALGLVNLPPFEYPPQDLRVL